MFEAFAERTHRRVTLILVAIGVSCFVLASILGISDNPPGLILLLLGAIAVVLALVHPWRSVRNYRILFLVGVVAFPILVVVHNVTEVVGGRLESGLVAGLLLGISVVTFVLAIFGSPPAAAIGLAGWLVFGLRSLRERSRRGPAQP